jgi:hypothetical protein
MLQHFRRAVFVGPLETLQWLPVIRIIFPPREKERLPFAVGVVLGADAASIMAGDPDLVSVLAVVIGAATEAVYAYAKKKGWAT